MLNFVFQALYINYALEDQSLTLLVLFLEMTLYLYLHFYVRNPKRPTWKRLFWTLHRNWRWDFDP